MGTYNGNVASFNPVQAYDFTKCYAINVNGDSPNPDEHMLLNVGGRGGWYFHVVGPNEFPRYMNEIGYKKYMNDHQKKEIRKMKLPVPNPDAAMAKLSELLSKKWLYNPINKNCFSFVYEVIKAGGSPAKPHPSFLFDFQFSKAALINDLRHVPSRGFRIVK